MAVRHGTDGPAWPQSKFYFEVDFGDQFKIAPFEEAYGLEAEAPPIESKNGNSEPPSPIKMPGVAKYRIVTMRRGIFVSDNKIWDLMTEINMNIIVRRSIFIKLLDDTGRVAVQWQLTNAWPAGITGADMNSTRNEVTVDSLKIAHEQLVTIAGR